MRSARAAGVHFASAAAARAEDGANTRQSISATPAGQGEFRIGMSGSPMSEEKKRMNNRDTETQSQHREKEKRVRRRRRRRKVGDPVPLVVPSSLLLSPLLSVLALCLCVSVVHPLPPQR